MPEVSTVEKQSRIPFEAIQAVVDQIKDNFRPEKIILFGSCVHGNPRPESDVDLLVIMPLKNGRRPIEQAIEIAKSVEYEHGYFGLDVIVRSPEEIARRIKWRDFFILDAIEKDKVLYESSSP